MTDQLELLPEAAATRADATELSGWLRSHGWQSRSDLAQGLGWSARKLRVVMELMGADIVRSQHGFKLTEQLTRDDLEAAKQAADAAISQAKKQEAYGLALLRRIHQLVG